jgi:uncharacterized cupredoxin-like copper-binding protein
VTARRRFLSAMVLAAALPAAAGACRAGDGERTVQIDIRHSRFSTEALEVEPGRTVRFVLRNLDPIDHEFILGDQAVQQRHEDGTEPYHPPRPGEVTVLAGTTATTTYTFGEPGGLLFGCHLPGHWDYGMRGTVRVG